MSASVQDYQLAALAAGFTLGFGFLTVWEAIKQTRRNQSPLRSAYIYMIWGEILVNFIIGIIGWLFLNGKLGPTVPVLFSILFFWVFEIQLLMQIIINRIALIAENRSTIFKLKWGTVILITAINIAVFCIWIPSHTVPPVSQTFVAINDVWDKISKVIILIVDAGLNWYFLRTVKIRLVQQHGLTKYAPLVGFNGKLMVVSIAMDALLIGLMFLPNQVVYIQFHPVVYMTKLNIEMSMASLVVCLARGKPQNDMDPEAFGTSTDPKSQSYPANAPSRKLESTKRSKLHSRKGQSDLGLSQIDSEENLDEGGIKCKTEVQISITNRDKDFMDRNEFLGSCSRSSNDPPQSFGDEIPLQQTVGS
ncbi:MFS multidrug transporter [Pyrenophora seminiperda CCB06]|uniref:MFS multidrug transporter n=1 Tax=Pyrenophora seminiperda CCB06 TaxID=1302712 RepID=A0A3M7MFL6_9PLEO|nr:MFS multidrug transporter [Pyrenophora seminiperda CCB06]